MRREKRAIELAQCHSSCTPLRCCRSDSIVVKSSFLTMTEHFSLLVSVKYFISTSFSTTEPAIEAASSRSSAQTLSDVLPLSLSAFGVCHHDIGLRLRRLFGDRLRRTPTLWHPMVATELARSRFSKLKLANSWSPASAHVPPYTLSWNSWDCVQIHVCEHDGQA